MLLATDNKKNPCIWKWHPKKHKYKDPMKIKGNENKIYIFKGLKMVTENQSSSVMT